MPTPTLAVVTAPIEGDRIKEAEDFFYHIKLHLASGELDHIAEEARFPITVNVEGQPKTFVYAAELGEFLPRILSPQQISRLMATDESELTYTSEGVRVLDGILWFNLFCLDAACIEPEFLITEINN